MFTYDRKSSREGFTLVEIMIVIAMIALLLGSGFFPYAYYMERARVERTLDTVSQEWIIAHQQIRGGLLHAGTGSHAHMYVVMKRGDSFITLKTSTGGMSPKKDFKTIRFDGKIQILGFTGAIAPTETNVIYHISPPFATGAFSTGGVVELPLSGVIMTVGYPGATRESRRARDILLRPYFD